MPLFRYKVLSRFQQNLLVSECLPEQMVHEFLYVVGGGSCEGLSQVTTSPFVFST